jgi:hypothetical protein
MLVKVRNSVWNDISGYIVKGALNTSWYAVCIRCENIASLQVQRNVRIEVRNSFQSTARVAIMNALDAETLDLSHNLVNTVRSSARRSLWGI